MEISQYIALVQAAKRCPTRPHAGGIWRWCRMGVKSRSGDRIKLSRYASADAYLQQTKTCWTSLCSSRNATQHTSAGNRSRFRCGQSEGANPPVGQRLKRRCGNYGSAVSRARDVPHCIVERERRRRSRRTSASPYLSGYSQERPRECDVAAQEG